uniref:Putative secreted protein n=1 Tax=Ixodes ricinus TaxID=34613 RepID=A0A6B0U2K1_IXORI
MATVTFIVAETLLPVTSLWVYCTMFLPSVSTDDRLVFCFYAHNRHYGSTACCESGHDPRRKLSPMTPCVPVSTDI